MKANKKALIYVTISLASVAIIIQSILIFGGVLILTNSPLSQGSVVEDADVFVSTNQTAIQELLDQLEVEGLATEKFTIATNTLLFDSNKQAFPQTTFLGVTLEKQDLTDQEGNKLDLGSIQVSFDGVGTGQNKNLEIMGTLLVYLDDKKEEEKKLYRYATLQNKTIPLYITDEFSEPTPTQRQTAWTYTFTDEELSTGQHAFRIILKDIVFRNFATDEKWYYIGETEVYNLLMTVNEQKKVVYDEELQQAISIFKSDSSLMICGQAINYFINADKARVNEPTTVWATAPSYNIYQNNEKIGSLSLVYPISNHDRKLDDKFYCSSFNEIPRNSKILLVGSDGRSTEVITPKSQKIYQINCALNGVSTNNVIPGASITSKCKSNFYEN